MSAQITPDTPAMVPPLGQVSNFVDPPDFYKWTLAVGITSMAIMTMSVGMRTYTKIVLIRDVRHEDYIAVLALLGLLAWSGIYLYLAGAGFTRDLWNIRAVDMPHFLYLLNAFEVLYGPVVLCSKYFILVQLRRIFCPPGHRGAIWWTLNVLIGITVAYYISCFFTFLFQCVPREKIWNPSVDGHCIANSDGILSAGIINVVLDVSILATPIWAVWHLGLPVKRKLGVIAIFSVGFITCGLATAGIAYRVPLIDDPNVTHATARLGLWTFAELTGTLVVGCMPMMPRFWEARLQPGLAMIANSLSLALSSLSCGLFPSHDAHASRATAESSCTVSIRETIVKERHDRIFESHGFVEFIEDPHVEHSATRDNLETHDTLEMKGP